MMTKANSSSLMVSHPESGLKHTRGSLEQEKDTFSEAQNSYPRMFINA